MNATEMRTLRRKITILRADTHAEDVADRLPGMTDGDYRVIAVEVFDHPDAIVPGPTLAEAHGLSAGDKLGTWILGRPEDVYAYLDAAGWLHHAEQYGAGVDPES